MTKTEEIKTNLRFLEGLEPKIVAFLISFPMEGEICVIYNANREAKTVRIPEGEWKVYAKGKQAGKNVLEVLTGGTANVEAISAMILARS